MGRETLVEFVSGELLFGKYRLEKKLGIGGMGTVWLARNEDLEKQVALKMPRPEILLNERALNNLRREAVKGARLEHPHIVRVYDFVQQRDVSAIVLEYMDGGTLDDAVARCEKGHFELQDLLKWLEPVCAALDHAHDQGVVHRDLKPANLMCEQKSGRVKIADFGLAATMNESMARLSQQSGGGSPAYMSPQQAEGRFGQPMDDIYSLGATLFDLLAGSPPFSGPNLFTLCREVVPVTVSERRAEMGLDGALPSCCDDVIAACLAKKPTERPGSAREVWERLQDPGGVKLSPPHAEASMTPTPVSAPFGATKESPWENSLGMKFVPVPQTDVLFSVWETRRKDYEAYTQVNDGVNDEWHDATYLNEPVGHEPDHPVVCVNWEDANAFCQWLTQAERTSGKIPADASYRLPTDEEWSWAIGLAQESGFTPKDKDSGVKNVYPWGTQWPPPKNAGNYNDVSLKRKLPGDRLAKNSIEGYEDGYVTTSPVGRFAMNRFGLFDMSGNVAEWCQDAFQLGGKGSYIRKILGSLLKKTKEKEFRVLRGGSWDVSDPGSLLSSCRGYFKPGMRDVDIGFRIVLVRGSTSQSDEVIPDSPAKRPTERLGTDQEVWELMRDPVLSPLLVEDPTTPTPTSDPSGATKELPWENGLGMRFVPLPQTEVLFSVWETRRKDYEVYAQANDGVDDKWSNATYQGKPVGHDPDHPVVCVSWEDAIAFCRWLTKKERASGQISVYASYRLPTDDEWSRAVGLEREAWTSPQQRDGGVKNVYPWGTQWPPPSNAGNYNCNSYETTSPVGEFAMNRYGLFDLGGNVWEWCEDWYDQHERSVRVVRGGSWFDYEPKELLSSRRYYNTPVDRNELIGFRVVLTGVTAR